ncbi:MAG: response regulator transcription factor, partial [Actinomycetota bacterium]
ALFDSIMAGAAGYLLKGVPAKDLVRSIRDVGQGRALLDPAVTHQVPERIRNPIENEKDPRLSRLSPTEERVLDLVAEGLTNRQIGERINLSDKTIKNYVSSILQKLQVARRSEAASYVTRVRSSGTHPEEA